MFISFVCNLDSMKGMISCQYVRTGLCRILMAMGNLIDIFVGLGKRLIGGKRQKIVSMAMRDHFELTLRMESTSTLLDTILSRIIIDLYLQAGALTDSAARNNNVLVHTSSILQRSITDFCH
jgi:hypothetical protein